MSLLVLEHVCKSYKRGSRERVALRDVSLCLDAGEFVTVWGRRRSGRSTLLRVAAGAERPDAGVVRFEGRDLAARGGARLGDGIRYCLHTFTRAAGRTVLEEVMSGLLVCGVAPRAARSRARAVLERVDSAPLEDERPSDLERTERVRVAIACALTSDPRLLVIDEPTIEVDFPDRDAILMLLRSLADKGIAILASVGETTGLLGADRALRLSDGRLHGALEPEIAPVVPLRRSRSG